MKQTAEEDKAELNNYDSKIYSASTQMAPSPHAGIARVGDPVFQHPARFSGG